MNRRHSFSAGSTLGKGQSVVLDQGTTAQFAAQPPRLMQGDVEVILDGGHAVGDVLRVRVERSVMLGMTAQDFAVQWHRDGKAIPWENERTYQIRPNDSGHHIGCWVTDACRIASDERGVP